MDSLWRMASGSSIEHFARDVYLKSNLTTEMNRIIKSLQRNHMKDNKILMECDASISLCNTLEAILLHGLKQKLTFRVTSVFSSGSPSKQRNHAIDFWPVILILCHNEVSRSLQQLKNIYSDVGRCRAWLRSALNDGLINSYLESLTCDASLLNGFYRSSAYLRDEEHTDLLRHLLQGLDSFIFQMTIDSSSLNSWSWDTLKLLGIEYVCDEPSPVMAAVDAIQLISNDSSLRKHEIIEKHKHLIEDPNQQSKYNQLDDEANKIKVFNTLAIYLFIFY